MPPAHKRHALWRTPVLVLVCGFLTAALANDLKDLVAQAQGKPVPQCATWSLVRPARCR